MSNDLEISARAVLQKLQCQVKTILPETLREWLMKDPKELKPFVIIDVRDSDHKYAHIKGSIHCGSRQFTSQLCKELMEHYPPEQYRYVFHCMRSQNRGPRCARKFLLLVATATNAEVIPEVYVLEGGFKQWLQRFSGTSSADKLIEIIER